MASASEQLYEQKPYDNSQPLSYGDWRDQAISDWANQGSGWDQFWRGFFGWPKILNSNDADIGRQGYNDYLERFRSDQDVRNASIAEYNQRKYDEYMSSTAYQRAYEDIQKTGLNPAILLNSAFGPASHGNSAQAFSYNSNKSNSKNESNNRSFSASAVLAALVMLAAKVLL